MKKQFDYEKMSPEAVKLVAERFRLLGEPIRLMILQSLMNGEMSVGEITDAVESSQPNISKHLKMMQSSDIVLRRQQGNNVYYSIADQSIFELCELVCGSLQKNLESRYEKMQTVFSN